MIYWNKLEWLICLLPIMHKTWVAFLIVAWFSGSHYVTPRYCVFFISTINIFLLNKIFLANVLDKMSGSVIPGANYCILAMHFLIFVGLLCSVNTGLFYFYNRQLTSTSSFFPFHPSVLFKTYIQDKRYSERSC